MTSISIIKSLFLGGILLALSIQYCTAISCYQCNSGTGDTNGDLCKDPFNDEEAKGSSMFKPCPDKVLAGNKTTASYCRKTTQKTALAGMKAEEKRIIRDCGYEQDERLKPDDASSKGNLKCYRRVGTFEVEMLYCGCYTDACNPAGRVEPLALLLLIPLALIHHQVFNRF